MSPKENLLSALGHEEPDWVPFPMVDGSWAVVGHGLVERPERPGYDDWGVRWELREEGIGTFPVEHPIKEPEQVEGHEFPDPERPEVLRPMAEAADKVDRRRALLFGDNGWGLFERAWLLVGMERLLLWMAEEPEAVALLMHRIGRSGWRHVWGRLGLGGRTLYEACKRRGPSSSAHRREGRGNNPRPHRDRP